MKVTVLSDTALVFFVRKRSKRWAVAISFSTPATSGRWKSSSTLRRIAPVRAVRGNVDRGDLSELPQD